MLLKAEDFPKAKCQKPQPVELGSPLLDSLGSNPFALLTYFVTSHFYLSGSQVPHMLKKIQALNHLVDLVGF